MPSITRTKCPLEQRLTFLPKNVGQNSGRFLRYEHLTYTFMEKACPDYNGGFWEFYSLSNDGFYIAPDSEDLLKMQWHDNYFDGVMSADAAGICISLMAQSAFAWEVDSAHFGEKFNALRDYAAEHEEAAMIFRFID